MNTDQKKDDLLRRLIPGPDGQSPVWLYPDGSHRCVTRFDVSDINAALAITRAQPVADDAGGDELEQGDYVLATKYGDGDPFDHWCVGFFDRKDGDRYHVNDDKGNPFRLGGFRRVEKISNEYGHFLVENKDRISTKTDKDQVVGSLWDSEISIRAALRQPAAADNRGVDVDGIKKLAYTIKVVIQNFRGRPALEGIYGGAVPLTTHADCISDWAKEIQALLRTTPEDGKGDVNLPDWVINRIKDNIDAARLNVETTRDADKFIMDHYLFDKDFWEVIYSLIPATQQPEHEGG